MSEPNITSTLCPRGVVVAQIFNNDMQKLANAINGLTNEHSPCKCNDKVDTMQAGSQTCLAVHAEVRALMQAWSFGAKFSELAIMVTSRPPCRNCIKVLLATPIHTIIVSPQYEDRDNSKQVWTSAGRTWEVQPNE